MKKIFFFSILMTVSSTISLAQTFGWNYQAVMRDANGDVLKNTSLDLQFQILADTNQFASPSYVETQPGLVTDQFGLISTVLGKSAPDLFDTLDWYNSAMYLKVLVRIPPSQVFNSLGGSKEIIHPPYAGKSSIWELIGDTVWGTKGRKVLIGDFTNTPIMVSPSDGLSVIDNIRLGPRIHPGGNGTENGYSLVHFKNGTTQHGGVLRASQGNDDKGNAPILYQASRHQFEGSAIGTPFANGSILQMSSSSGQGVLVFGSLNTAGDVFIQSAKVGGPSTLVLNPEGGMVDVPCLRITGGCDITEPFSNAKSEDLPKGSVVVIDEDNPGMIRLGFTAYDNKVAGVISGAGTVSPGLTLSQAGVLDNGQQMALAGRVYVRACVSNGSICPGDMLTTSEILGVAMRATDLSLSQGAVLGKAMSGLEEGEGLVLVLINLQ